MRKYQPLWVAMLCLLASPAVGQMSSSTADFRATAIDTSHLAPEKAQKLREKLLQLRGAEGISIKSKVIVADPDSAYQALTALRANRDLDLNDLEQIGAPTGLARATSSIPRSWQQRPAEPGFVPATIQGQQQAEVKACRSLPSGDQAGCLGRVQAKYVTLPAVVTDSTALSAACDDKVRAYNLVLQGCGETPCGPADARRAAAVGAPFDAACLSTVWDAPPPITFSDGASAVEAALRATALFELAGVDDIPFCTGLFLNATTVLTAKHCFTTLRYQKALTRGLVRVRQASRADGPSWQVSAATPVTAADLGRPLATSDDYIRLTVAVGPPDATPTKFGAPHVLESVFVPGVFRDADPKRRGAMTPEAWAAAPQWWRDLRWARKGACHVIYAASGCVRLLCETVSGYSGAPIFAPAAKPADPLVVYGLVRGSEGDQVSCGPGPVAEGTIGVVPSGF